MVTASTAASMKSEWTYIADNHYVDADDDDDDLVLHHIRNGWLHEKKTLYRHQHHHLQSPFYKNENKNVKHKYIAISMVMGFSFAIQTCLFAQSTNVLEQPPLRVQCQRVNKSTKKKQQSSSREWQKNHVFWSKIKIALDLTKKNCARCCFCWMCATPHHTTIATVTSTTTIFQKKRKKKMGTNTPLRSEDNSKSKTVWL